MNAGREQSPLIPNEPGALKRTQDPGMGPPEISNLDYANMGETLRAAELGHNHPWHIDTPRQSDAEPKFAEAIDDAFVGENEISDTSDYTQKIDATPIWGKTKEHQTRRRLSSKDSRYASFLKAIPTYQKPLRKACP